MKTDTILLLLHIGIMVLVCIMVADVTRGSYIEVNLQNYSCVELSLVLCKTGSGCFAGSMYFGHEIWVEVCRFCLPTKSTLKCETSNIE